MHPEYICRRFSLWVISAFVFGTFVLALVLLIAKKTRDGAPGGDLHTSPAADAPATQPENLATATTGRASKLRDDQTPAQHSRSSTHVDAGAPAAASGKREFRSVDAVLNSLTLRLGAMHEGSSRAMVMKYLIGQFQRARDYINPGLMPNYEGIIFADTISVPPSLLPEVGPVWCILLAELGCSLSEAQKRRLCALIADLAMRNRVAEEELVPEAENEDYGPLEEYQTGIFDEFTEKLTGILEPEDLAAVVRFLQDLSFQVLGAR